MKLFVRGDYFTDINITIKLMFIRVDYFIDTNTTMKLFIRVDYFIDINTTMQLFVFGVLYHAETLCRILQWYKRCAFKKAMKY